MIGVLGKMASAALSIFRFSPRDFAFACTALLAGHLVGHGNIRGQMNPGPPPHPRKLAHGVDLSS
jgi:hypothetical protein